MSKHTPGPWNRRQEYNVLRDEIGVPGKAICTVWVRKEAGFYRDEKQIVPDEEGEANARLIIAAPDMYKALIDAASAGVTVDGPACAVCLEPAGAPHKAGCSIGDALRLAVTS